MKQELIDGIKKDYQELSKQTKHNYTETSENLDIHDKILDEAIKTNLYGVDDIGSTNKIWMYIAEMRYGTFAKLFSFPTDNINPEDIYILYIDIESDEKCFISKDNQKSFESTNDVVVMYKNPNCNQGGNFDRNIEGLQSARREFIKDAFYTEQEEAARQFIKKYQERRKD